MTNTQSGLLALVASCTIWGLSPLYYKLLVHVPPMEILAHRTVWSLVFFLILLGAQRRIGALPAALSTGRAVGITLICALMISTNWALFIWSVQVGRTTEASLGYYIFPLVAVLMGVVVFRERLSRLQWASVALAAVAVLVLTVGLGAAPWISLVLAVTFGTYGLIKKGTATGPVVSVAGEVALLTPVALLFLLWWTAQGWGHHGDPATLGLLMVSGVLTGGPLVLFSYGARRVRMATTGLVQYLNPTLQFLCAVLIFGEPFGPVHMVAFALIWIALALYSGVSLVQDRARRKIAIAASGELAD
ncbi:EamA family transporter RarD [Cognatishimia sp. F0-27]|uniref:EamA family transporter RarD n=1 Tax=Cognatishimia sp. F0-27 TaxID=2816855 RepID=UPI001D0C0841|nr:EamA family transporter RarD [Cognatishimia sp. F0-27]MCC1494926.1 EamA family transporter RarD [Cognatishimia sp. F0-27]